MEKMMDCGFFIKKRDRKIIYIYIIYIIKVE